MLLESLAKAIKDNGFHIVAEILKAITVPSTAEWRWGTLHAGCQTLSGVLDTLRHHWSPSFFDGAKDAKTLKRACAAVNSVAWRWQFCFVHWLCNWLCSIQSWGKGSKQLEAARSGESVEVDAMGLGRRLADAEEFVARSLRNGVSEVSGWDVNFFPGASLAEVAGLQACARAAYVLADKRFKYLSHLPWLLARLEQPGVRDRCVALYNSHRQHVPLTEKFMDPAQDLRADIDRLSPTGSGASPLLKSWIQVIQNFPMDDSLAEGPHARGNRIGRHGTKTSFAWTAATMRLEQNINDAHELTSALGEDLEALWYCHSSVLQTKAKSLNRPVRCTPQVYRSRLYQLGKFADDLPTATAAEAAGNSDNDNDDEAGSQAGQGFKALRPLLMRQLKAPLGPFGPEVPSALRSL